MEWAEVSAQVRAIEGFLSDTEAQCLYRLARKCDGNIVEIGSWKGKSTVCLALGTKAGAGGKVFAIDPHQGLADNCARILWPEHSEVTFRQNIKGAGVDNIVIPLVMKSEDAAKGWTGPISLLWIDGAHDYENVKKDFSLWEPHIKRDGVIAFHDALYAIGHNYPGVRRIIRKHLLHSNKFSDVQYVGSIVYATKVESLSIPDTFLKLSKSFLYLVIPLLYWASNLVNASLTRVGLLAPARAIKDKALSVAHRRAAQQ